MVLSNYIVSMLLFVYGSLRKGFPNHYLVEDSPYIGEFTTVEKYLMVGTKSKSFPYILYEKYAIADQATKIIGEVYDISEDTLKKIDQLEGHPDTYLRLRVCITNGNDFIFSSIYILENIDIIEEIYKNIGDRFGIVVSGDWKKYCLG